MPIITGTMKFKETITPQTLTWVETHAYVPGGASLADALVALKTLANLRVQMLGAGVILTQLFVSDQLIWRDSGVDELLPPFTDLGGLPVYNRAWSGPNANFPADFAYSSCNVRLEASPDASSNLYRRTLWLSGNPDAGQEITKRDPTSLPAWLVAWTNFKGLLAGTVAVPGRWGMLVRSRQGGAAVDKRIVHINPTTGEIVVRDALAGIAVNDNVVVRNVRGLVPRIAGIYRVAAKTTVAGVTTLVLPRVGTSGGGSALGGTYKGTGWLRKYVPVAIGYTNAIIEGFGAKRRGDSVDRAKGTNKRRPAVI